MLTGSQLCFLKNGVMVAPGHSSPLTADLSTNHDSLSINELSVDGSNHDAIPMSSFIGRPMVLQSCPPITILALSTCHVTNSHDIALMIWVKFPYPVDF